MVPVSALVAVAEQGEGLAEGPVQEEEEEQAEGQVEGQVEEKAEGREVGQVQEQVEEQAEEEEQAEGARLLRPGRWIYQRCVHVRVLSFVCFVSLYWSSPTVCFCRIRSTHIHPSAVPPPSPHSS